MDFTIEEMKNDIKIPLSMLKISFLEIMPYKGSYKGKRFMFRKEGNVLKVYLWKEPFNFEKTEKRDIKEITVDFTKDGIEKGLIFIVENEVV